MLALIAPAFIAHSADSTLEKLGSGPAALAAPKPRVQTGQKWADMEYGPFLSASIEAPQPATNIAFKGIAIRLAEAFGGQQNEAVVFDTDLLRYSAGWTGDFVALKGVVFDGEHWAYPHIDGEQVFGNAGLPGWANQGSFKDPREFIYGPLPRDWAHWKGLFLHGQKVVLAYTVGQTEVLEMPGLEKGAGLTAFSRTINLGKSDRDLALQIAFESGRSGQVVSLDTLAIAPADAAAGHAVALLAPERGRLPAKSPAQGDLRVPAAPASSADPARPVQQGLLAQWDFDQAQGETALDQSPSQRTIRLHNHRWVPGHTGRALELSGNGYGQLDRAEDVDFTRSDLAFAVWINTRHDGTILSQTAPEGPWIPDGKTLFIRGGKLTFDIGWVGAVAAQRSVANGRWQHVAMTWSHQDGMVTLYVNGVREGSGVLKPKNPTRGHAVRVGYTSPNFPQTSFFQGQVDDLRLYGRKLNEMELRTLAGPAADTGIVAAGVVGAPAGAKWITTADGHVRLHLPAAATPVRFKVLLARVAEEALPRFAQLARQATPAMDLQPLTQGGPPRWPQTISTRGRLGPDAGPYAIDTITWPDDNPWNSWMRFGGFDFFQDGTRAALCTWNGDVWIVSGMDGKLESLSWRRFATGLYQPLGLKIVEDRVYVLGRDQITRLHDLNEDGEADWHENFNNDTLNTEHFHEFALDLQTDAAGSFYYMKGARHARDALHPQHGTLIKVSKDGARSEIIAKGFRAPNGLTVSPAGEFFSTDQEGYWMPANRLNLIKRGGFYGNTWSWFPEGKPTQYEPPLCWLNPKVDRSPSTMAWVTSDRWGPLQDRLLSLSYGVGRIFLVLQETVNGVRQGGVTPLPVEFDTGIMRGRFHPRDGQFYVCGLFGWAGNKTQAGGFYRVRYTGLSLRLPNELHVATNGVVLTFTDPLDPSSAMDTGNYSVEMWNYRWTENYGSPDFKLDGSQGRDRLKVASAHLARDERTVFLRLPGICPVMQMHIQMNLKTADGAPIRTFVHNTIHALGNRSGEEWLGEQAVATVRQVQFELKNEASGLAQTFVSRAAATGGAADTRRSRLLALNVPAGSPPTPFLPPGPFVSTWRGFIKLDLSDSYAFHATGRGKVTVRVNGELAISAGGNATPFGGLDARDAGGGKGVAPRLLQLRGGLNRIEVAYESPPSGEAAFRLFWSNAKLPMEAVPPTALVHDAGDPELRKGETRRLGRQLFVTRHCAQCHIPSVPFANAMPELAAEAPVLDNCGRRFNPSWIARWLEQPAALLPDATMPACLTGSEAEVQTQARDIAAYLATLISEQKANSTVPGTEPSFSPASLLIADRIQAGEALFAKLGCVACHSLPGDEKLAGDTRRPLGHVQAKWQPVALIEFLRAPGKYYAWTRMPDFQLSAGEAESLAAYLISRSDPVGAEAGLPVGGDSQQGRELVVSLGCVNCHRITGVSPAEMAAGLETVAGKESPRLGGRNAAAPVARNLDSLAGTEWRSGCLAREPSQRGHAADFRFDYEQREALQHLLEHDIASLRQDTWTEFANRQIAALRCTACHQRENEKDFWFALEALEASKKPKPVNPFDDEETQDRTIHRSRPPLIFTGEKLRPEWMEQLFLGKLSYKPRPKLEARMPAFPAYARGLAHGLALDHGLDSVSPEPGPVNHELANVGQALIQKGALACVDCHAVGAQPALAGADTSTINFAHVPDRLRKDYFDRYLLDPQRLLPGTMMPKFVNDEGLTGLTTHFDGNARKQFDAIWQYMRTIPMNN